MHFAVSFQKNGPNLGAIIIGAEVTHSDASTIGANFFYVVADVASPRGRRHKSWRRPPLTARFSAIQGVGAKIYGADPLGLAISAAT
jgi:hypothetical protein